MAAEDRVDIACLRSAIGAGASRARKRLGFTQEDAAELLGVTFEFYARIDRGNGMPSLMMLRTIGERLHVRVDELLGVIPFDEESSPGVAKREDTIRLHRLRPEMRRLLRLLRRASPRTLDVLILLLDRLEEIAEIQEPDVATEGQEPDAETDPA